MAFNISELQKDPIAEYILSKGFDRIVSEVAHSESIYCYKGDKCVEVNIWLLMTAWEIGSMAQIDELIKIA
jgi:hypothetical protein